MMNVIIITQARIGSTRLSGKILKRINGQSLLEIHLSRLKKSKLATKIIVATTFEPGVEQIIEIGKKMAVDVFQGATDDVLDRFYQSVKKFAPNYIVRVTSDCPLIDPELVDKVIEMAKTKIRMVLKSYILMDKTLKSFLLLL
jgi:spore coat polysaccharide biosynthesis protein SpsF